MTNMDHKEVSCFLMTHLSCVEAVRSLIQQEESQREILEIGTLEVELTTLYNKNENPQGCS